MIWNGCPNTAKDVRQHVDAAAGVHVGRRDAITPEEMHGRVHQRREHDGDARTGLALDRGEHGAAQKGFFDECHGEAGDDAAQYQV